MKELPTKIAFQDADLLADGRRRYPQFFRCAREISQAGGGLERMQRIQMAEKFRHLSSIKKFY